MPDSLIRAILGEVSAENALRETTELAARVRYPESQSFFDAAEYVAGRARAYGLENVTVERFPSKHPLWDPLEAELDLVSPVSRRLSSLADVSVLLAQGSRDGDVTAPLVEESGEVRDKVVLTSKSPETAWRELSGQHPAALVCAFRPEYFGRQPPPDAVAWEQAPADALALMISPRQGDELRAMLHQGAVTVRVHARARRASPGEIGQVMGEIPGEVKGRDIVLAAHLDHQKPGANDNASGSGTLLEVLRTLKSLISTGKVPRPRRTLRFWWTTEIRSEEAYFHKHPEEAKQILMAVVLDQAGGDRDAVNNFIVINGPDWLPAFTDDLIYDLAEFVQDSYAPPEHEPSPMLVASGGSTQSMRTVYWDYQPLSDHLAFEARHTGIPAIALAVPSLHLIHTNLDTADRLDPTWLKRSALMTLAPALYMAGAGPKQAQALLEAVFHRAAARIAAAAEPERQLALEHKRLDSVAALDASIRTEDYQARLAAIAKALRR